MVELHRAAEPRLASRRLAQPVNEAAEGSLVCDTSPRSRRRWYKLDFQQQHRHTHRHTQNTKVAKCLSQSRRKDGERWPREHKQVGSRCEAGDDIYR